MKYALTITSDPNAYDWGDTDTILFEYPDTLPERDVDVVELVERVLQQYGWKGVDVEDAVKNGWCFIRNCADTDVVINKKGE